MPQNTNLNVSPYFDDFEKNKNYNRVLFKPGTPIQARELTTLQTILQNQIESFGQHFFKEGSMVIPGQVSYDPEYTCVQIDDTHLGVPVSFYIDNLIGKRIQGESSGIIAKVENYITNSQSERGVYTLYVKYQSSSERDFTETKFLDGENLTALEDIPYGVSTIRSGTSFSTCSLTNSTFTGSAAKIESGVYFIRGNFVDVSPQTLVLDQYSNSPSYRIGLSVNEEIVVASNSNPDLFDNAQGFSNYAAPGADRLKIEAELIKKPITDFNDENFIELLRVENGIIQNFVKTSNYNLIRDELARRTYDESGDYYISPFKITTKESLNDRIGNEGIFLPSQKTKQGNTPNESLGCLVVSPGKAFVRGYEVETIDTTIVDFEKTRDTERAISQTIPISVGRQFILNNVSGSIPVGFTTNSQVNLYDSRTATVGIASGSLIGVARIYDLKLKNAEYTNKTTQFECSLYDIQTYTDLVLNTSITLSTPAFIEGNNSSASGYLVQSVTNSNILKLYQVSGSFRQNESFKINGISNGRIITSSRDYNLSDVHQFVTQNSTSGLGTFTADPVLSNSIALSEQGAQFTISPASVGVSTITTSNATFYVGIKTGDIISYTKQSASLPTYNKVVSINSNNRTISIQATPSVSLINDGTLPVTTITTTDLKKVTLSISDTSSTYLYEKLNHKDISRLDLTGSQIFIRKSYLITIAANSYSGTLETNPGLTLSPFDEEDYNLTYINTGVVESLTDQKLIISGRTISLSNLSQNGAAILTVTYIKSNIAVKNKFFNRCSSLIVSRSNSTSSGIGLTTLNDGLIYSNVYGVRVQDKEICLNVPDVTSIVGIYESSDIGNPSLPKILFTSLNSNINNLIRGELIIGQNSGAVAVFVESDGINSVEVSYLNENRFSQNEVVIFQETNILGIVNSISFGDKNIKNNFILDDGQRSEYYDYSRLIRKTEFSSPTKKIKIIYNHFTIDSSSEGDFVGVDSYEKDRYKTDIGKINDSRNSDIIDLRPRVSTFTLTSLSRSPFEYQSRVFSFNSNSSSSIFAKDKTLTISYDYYLPRVDKLFLSKEGTFILNKGVPSLKPKSPNNLDSSLEIATIYYPAYIYNTSSIYIQLASHKRYTMKDISNIENRLSNVEYFTSLSLLELDTKNVSIRDSRTGLEKFKSGFFVDNFKSYDGGDVTNKIYRSSIDTSYGYLRPSHYSTSIDLLLGSESIIGIGTTSIPDIDLRYASDLGSNNVKRIGDVVCLNYNDTIFIENLFATSYQNVNPFNITNWVGSIELNPTSDTWIYPLRTQRNDDIQGNYNRAISRENSDTNSGISPIEWDSWETLWTGSSSIEGPNTLSIQSLSNELFSSVSSPTQQTSELVTSQSSLENSSTYTGRSSARQGIQFGISDRNSTIIGDLSVSTSVTTTMRSRNIEIIARRMKPSTRLYTFFDNVDLTNYVVPKLLEVSMVSGTFQEGETVIGRMTSGGYQTISFRLAKQNHRYGPYNSPTQVYLTNPYDTSISLSNSYSSTSSILNIDTVSLEEQSQSSFFGCVSVGMQLIGQTSNACATVSDIRLVSDPAGTFIGSLFIPDPSIPSTPSFSTGSKTLTLTSSSTNNQTVSGFNGSIAESNFISSGISNLVERATISIRNPIIERNTTPSLQTSSEIESRLLSRTSIQNRLSQFRTVSRGMDPLAQTFEVSDSNGIMVTKCDIFFNTKDSGNVPITLQIRTTSSGVPTQEVLPFSEVTLDPSQISTSQSSLVGTTFVFPSPVYLEPGYIYALVLVSNSNEYSVWTSTQGQQDISSANSSSSDAIIVSQQPILGSLFKPQNSSTWTPSLLDDLKFRLYRAEFTSTTGSVRFYNPNLNIGNNQTVSLRPNPISAYSNKIIVGISKSLTSVEVSNLTPGSNITQKNYPNFSGILESVVGSVGIGSQLTISNSGIGYTTNKTYDNVLLTTLNGRGSGARVNLTIQNNIAVAATVSIGGTGYAIGDTLTIDSSLTGNFGKNLIISIPNISGIISSFNSFIITNVQDIINTSGTGNEIQFTTPTGITTISNGFVNYSQILEDGVHFKVNHNNHGMYSPDNKVTLYSIESDYPPSTLLSELSVSSTTNIILSSVGIFTSFENKEVTLENPGYLKIGRELISYTGFNLVTNTLTGITRGFGVSEQEYLSIGYHPINSAVFKYEFNGISLRRINKTHSFSDTDLTKYPIELDSYHIKIDTTKDGTNRQYLHFNDTKTGGTYNNNITIPGQNTLNGPKATQNIQFDIIRPNVQTFLPETTNIETKVRTFSGSSIHGDDIPFVDQGYSSISLNSNNTFRTPRIIASRVNEVTSLQNYPGYKSFTMEMVLSTKDTKVSPLIDLDRVNIITTMNRIDRPIDNVETDPRVNSLYDDPHSAIYVSKIVRLDKSSDTLKVVFDAYTSSSNDIRVMYRLLRSDSPDSQQLYEFFPGYNNLDSFGDVIDPKNNSGKPDKFVNFSSLTTEFKTFEYTAKDLPLFEGYQIKIIMRGTNQSYVPLIKDFRAIALL